MNDLTAPLADDQIPAPGPGAPSAIEACFNIGGAGIGVRRAGFTENVLNVEVDPLRVEIARANGHDVMLADIQDVRWADYQGVTLVTGGPPCQPFVKGSFGNDLREFDPRDCLPMMIEIVAETKPMFFLVENIAMLAAQKNRGYVDTIVALFAEQGYDVEWRVIDCADFGTPQHRKRWVLMGARSDLECGVSWAEPFCGPGRMMPYQTVAKALGWALDHCEFCDTSLVECRMHGERRRREVADGRVLKSVDPHQPWSGIVFDHEPWCWERPAQTIMGRPLLNAPGSRANATNKSLMGQNDGVKVTLEQMARIQGLPAGYRLDGPAGKVAKAIGQVFPPQAAEAHIRALVRPVLGDAVLTPPEGITV